MTKDNKKELEECKTKAEEYLNGWKRAQADYINREKEIAKLRQTDETRFKEIFVLKILPILDNFESALAFAPKEQGAGSWVEGTLCIKKQLENVLKDLGVERIEVLGQDFDPRMHEAVLAENQQDEGSAGKIIKEVRPGYKIGDRVIRPAQVTIG